MSRRLYIKAKDNSEMGEVNAIEIFLYHSKERKEVRIVVQEVELRKENGMTITTSSLIGGVRTKVMDMPRFSKAKFDAIPLDDLLVKAMVNKLIEESNGNLELVLDDKGEWVIL